jgi:hypothetical protein
MLKSLVLVALLASTASAGRRTYDVKATRKAKVSMPSCGATARMLRDRHVLSIDDNNNLVGVNGLRWRVRAGEPDLVVTFHDKDGQKTWLMLDLYVNQRGLSGRYVLTGVIPDPVDPRKYEFCQDAVYLNGTRR